MIKENKLEKFFLNEENIAHDIDMIRSELKTLSTDQIKEVMERYLEEVNKIGQVSLEEYTAFITLLSKM